MAYYKFGNVWLTPSAELILVTTNREIKKNGRLVMGRGIAYSAAKQFPELPLLFAEHLEDHHKGKKFYGIIPAKEVTNIKTGEVRCIGAFQTKVQWRKPSKPKLIRRSLRILESWAISYQKHTINVAMPGVSNGGLNWFDVVDLIRTFDIPDNVIFWTRR